MGHTNTAVARFCWWAVGDPTLVYRTRVSGLPASPTSFPPLPAVLLSFGSLPPCVLTQPLLSIQEPGYLLSARRPPHSALHHDQLPLSPDCPFKCRLPRSTHLTFLSKGVPRPTHLPKLLSIIGPRLLRPKQQYWSAAAIMHLVYLCVPCPSLPLMRAGTLLSYLLRLLQPFTLLGNSVQSIL